MARTPCLCSWHGPPHACGTLDAPGLATRPHHRGGACSRDPDGGPRRRWHGVCRPCRHGREQPTRRLQVGAVVHSMSCFCSKSPYEYCLYATGCKVASAGKHALDITTEDCVGRRGERRDHRRCALGVGLSVAAGRKEGQKNQHHAPRFRVHHRAPPAHGKPRSGLCIVVDDASAAGSVDGNLSQSVRLCQVILPRVLMGGEPSGAG